jgi:hypothetical protein
LLLVPRDGDLYIQSVKGRCRDLIDAGIWQGITRLQLQAWLGNFITPEEEYFAACLLDALIYRSSDQTTALMSQLLHRTLPDLIRRDPLPRGSRVEWIDVLRDSTDRGIRVVPVIRDQDPPTKSGPLICRLYKRRFQLNDRWMIWPWQIESAVDAGVRTFLFVDDFVGTGTQFSRFCRRFDIVGRLKDAFAVYAPLVAHSTGLANLRRDYSSLRFCCVESLGDSHGLFGDGSPWFSDGTNSTEAALAFYFDLLSRRRIQVGEDYLIGFGKLGLAYAFEHAMPNNSIPLLWYRSANWSPLFNR